MSTDQFYDGILVRPSCRTHDNEIELWLSKNEVDGKNFLTVFHLSQGHSVIEFTDDIIALIKGGQVAANVMLFVPERCHLWQDQDKIEPHFESIQNRMMNHLAVAGFDDATVTLVHLEQPDTEIEVPYQAVVIIPPCTNHQQFLATHLEELGNRGVDPDKLVIGSLMGGGARM